MTFADFKARVDALMNAIYASGLTNHTLIIEQLNYLIFLRSLSKKDDQAIVLDPDAEKVFTGELEKFRWDNLLVLNAETLFMTIDELYKRIADLANDKTIRLLYQNAHLQILDKPTLRRVIHEIESVMNDLDQDYIQGHTDVFGDMYEHLLGTLSVAGRAGQYRTPRHIIDFIVDVVDPEKGETILDPACGTAGFLVAALEHLKNKYSSDDFKKQKKFPLDLLSPEERKFLFRHTLTGFDSDPSMFKFGLMNLYLHHLENPNIKRLNTLVDTAGDREKYNIILANPPFSGAIEEDSISEDLRMGTRSTEVLFLKFMIDHLSSNGRAGVVVPEGIIFSTSSAHKKIRKMLLEDAGLWSVVSLPAGVFYPYAGVKTSILFFDKSLVGKGKEVLFVKINNDGFSLNASRNPILKNDLPEALKALENWKSTGEVESSLVVKVPINEIKNHQNLDLNPNSYLNTKPLQDSAWPLVAIKDFCKVKKGSSITKKAVTEGLIPVIAGGQSPAYYHNEFNREGKTITVSASGAYAGFVNYFETPIFASDCSTIKVIDEQKVLPKYLFYILKGIQDKIYKLQRGGGQPHVYPGDLEELLVPLPPLDIQKKMVDEVTIYKKVVDGAKEIVENYKPSFSSKPSWKMVEIGDICKLMTGGTPRSSAAEYYGGEIKWLVSGDIHKEEIFDCDNRITEKGLKNSNAKILPLNSVLIALNGQGKTRGTVAILRTEATCNQSIVSIMPEDSNLLLPEYLYLVLKSMYREIREITGDNQRSGLNMPIIRRIQIPLASIAEQKEIVAEYFEEKKIIDGNKELIKIFENKIKIKVREIWGAEA